MSDPQPPYPPPPYEPPPGQGHSPQPPTAYAYAPRPPRKSSWPTVIGIISIVWGSIGTMGGCCSVGMAFFWKPYVEFMASIVPPAQRQQQMDMLNAYDPADPIMLGLHAVSLGLAILLIVAGARVLKRRAGGVQLSKIYAYMNIPLVIASALISLKLQSSMQADGPSPMPAESDTMFIAIIVAGTLLIGGAWPVFLLIWFGRAPIKEEIAGWTP